MENPIIEFSPWFIGFQLTRQAAEHPPGIALEDPGFVRRRYGKLIDVAFWVVGLCQRR
jgi:hypothetical protein